MRAIVRRLQAQKAPARELKVGTPSIDQLKEGIPEIWYIPGNGVRMVVKYRNKIYYSQFTTTI